MSKRKNIMYLSLLACLVHHAQHDCKYSMYEIFLIQDIFLFIKNKCQIL